MSFAVTNGYSSSLSNPSLEQNKKRYYFEDDRSIPIVDCLIKFRGEWNAESKKDPEKNPEYYEVSASGENDCKFEWHYFPTKHYLAVINEYRGTLFPGKYSISEPRSLKESIKEFIVVDPKTNKPFFLPSKWIREQLLNIIRWFVSKCPGSHFWVESIKVKSVNAETLLECCAIQQDCLKKKFEQDFENSSSDCPTVRGVIQLAELIDNKAELIVGSCEIPKEKKSLNDCFKTIHLSEDEKSKISKKANNLEIKDDDAVLPAYIDFVFHLTNEN